MRKALIYLLPLAVFLIVAVFLLRGLWLNPREVPSPFIDKPAPMFSLAQLAQPDAKFSPADMKGQVWLLNVWASCAWPAARSTRCWSNCRGRRPCRSSAQLQGQTGSGQRLAGAVG